MQKAEPEQGNLVQEMRGTGRRGKKKKSQVQKAAVHPQMSS